MVNDLEDGLLLIELKDLKDIAIVDRGCFVDVIVVLLDL